MITIKKLVAVTAICLTLSLGSQTLWEKYPIDFYKSMTHSAQFRLDLAQQSPQWQYLKKIYDKGMKTPFTIKGEPKIPLVFHLIWLGSKPPIRYHQITRQLKALHPGCTIKLWTDKEAKKYPMRNRKAFDAAVNYGEKSDIFRYEILHDEGGVYLDGDFDILKSFNELLYACNFFAGIAYDLHLQLYNGLIGCNAKHPIIKLCISDIGTKGSKTDVNAIMNRTGPHHFTRCFLKGVSKSPGITIAFPCPYFYPWPNYDRFNKNPERIKQWYKPYSFAVHKWACSWVK